MKLFKGRNFCDISPTCFKISAQKEICKRHLKDASGKTKFSGTYREDSLPVLISEHSNVLIKKGKGIDPVLQENKAVNINIACGRINGMIIHPGEEFSFWKTLGKITAKKGYKDGRVIVQNRLTPGMGGGLCNLANTINLLVLHSPLEITELHKPSDALAPDHGKRVPFSSGTSVSYNYIDYRFKNNTDRDFQLLAWCDDEKLHAQLRSTEPAEFLYRVTEEDHHFEKEGDNYYRVSKIYRETLEKDTEKIIEKQLIWDNHSKVMFDPDEIPKDQIR